MEAVGFIKSMKSMFEKNLDGKNINNLLLEFGNRIYG